MTQNGRYSVPGPGNIHREVFDNGLVVLVYENHAAKSVVMSGSLPAGSISDPSGQSGLASITAASLMRGTKNRDFETIHSEQEDIGADISIGARIHKLGFGGKALAEDLHVIVDVLGDSLRNPVFPTEQIERLRGERLTWLQYSQQDARYRVGRAFSETLYPDDYPYHNSTWGSIETVQKLELEAMRDFHRKHYGPQGMILVIVGGVDAARAIDTVHRHFGDWQNPDQPETPTLPELSALEESRRVFVPVPGKSQSEIILGTHGPSRYADDYAAAVLANSVLGEFGMMGRLGHVIREKLGLAYYAYSRMEGGHGPGAWSVVAGVNPDKVELTIERATDEIRRMTETPVSEEDAADVQSYYTGRLPLRLASNEGIASNLHTMESYGLGLDYLERYRERIYGVTREDMLAATRHYFNPDALVVSVAGPDQV